VSQGSNVLLKKKHLNSLISVDRWIKQAIDGYDNNKRVPLNDIEKYLNYLMHKIEQEIGSDKAEWLDMVEKLLKRVRDERDK